jgi:two-component system chemotaxis response regulator CheB
MMSLVTAVARRAARVLVVDDSVVVRRLVGRALDAEPGLELAGVAANGRIALEKLDRLQADVVILDLDMPEMNGFETLASIRRTHPALPVIVFSHLTSDGATATLDALALGATAFALKPRADGIGLAEEQVRTELFPLLLAVTSRTAAPAPPAPFVPGPVPRSHAVTAVVVAVSTGGPRALAVIIPSLPADLGVPILIVQHMPPLFTKTLAERLDRVAAIDVVEAAEGDVVVPGRVYLAPGGHHLALERVATTVRVVINDAPPENSCRPAADVLFRAAADVYGAGVLAVVLTGMGRDGLRGSEAVRAAGGAVIAQSADTSVVATMPEAVRAAGLVESVVPLDRIGPELVRRTSGRR